MTERGARRLAWTAVGDGGVGFDPASASRDSGLAGMADRLEGIGGSFDLAGAPGRGTTVSGRVPVRAEVSS